MRRTPAYLIVAMGVLALAAACGAGDPEPGQSGNGDGASAGGGIAGLAERLRAAGADVDVGGAVAQSFFAVPGQVLTVNGSEVQVYAYPSVEMAEADAAKVSPDGTTIGTTSVLWVSPPHFFRDAELLALYIGANDAVVELLASVLGPRFAGGATVPEPDVPEVPEAADAAARAALAARLGVLADSLLLVRAAEVTFANGALGCPQPGVAYTEALVPGFELLYEHERVRYQYHVSENGAQLTDCVGTDVEALPFRTGRGIVSVFDPLGLAERQEPLAAEVVLRTAEEAAAYVASHPAAVAIDTGAVDWSTQLLAGAVVTGTGCTFAAEVTGTRADHLSRAVDISAHAEATGLCEKFGALALWVILDDVPDDYLVGFILTSVGP